MKHDDATTLQELKDLGATFADERGWQQYHQPRNLATSIIIEAAELLEHFQWGDYSEQDKQEVADELSDILAYCFHLARALDIDVSTAYRDKLERAAKKYPVTLFNPTTQDRTAYHRIKQAYRDNKKPDKA
jgi:dCTP diphosphatase